MLIAAALQDEIRGFKSKMEIDCTIHWKKTVLYRGKVFNKDVDLLVTGIGKEKMEKGLVQALEFCSPDTVLLTGCAGGTTPVVSTGSLVLADVVVDAKSEKQFAPDTTLLEEAKKLCEEEKWNYQVGGMVTVDRIVSFPHEKADLGVTYRAMALEMESAAFAKIASDRKIPFLVVKAILDPVEEWLPPLEGWCEGHFLKSPKEMMKLPKIIYWASQARSAITKFLEGWIQSQ